jgi:hypothetical protein
VKTETKIDSGPSKVGPEQNRNVMNRNQYAQKLECYEVVTVGRSPLIVFNSAKSLITPQMVANEFEPRSAPSVRTDKGELAYIGLAELWFCNEKDSRHPINNPSPAR